MKVAVRGGHNRKATGAIGIIDEVTEDRKVKDSVIKYLKLDNQEVVDVTPDYMDSRDDLKYGVNKANSEKVDLFVSIHFNNAYSKYNGSLGTETLCNIGNRKSKEISQRITNNLVNLGFKDRGVKNGLRPKRLYEIYYTNMNSIIVEVCFVEATEDVRLYKKLGSDLIGKAIAEGIVGHNIKVENNSEEYLKNKIEELELIIEKKNNTIKEQQKVIDVIGRDRGIMFTHAKKMSNELLDLLDKVKKLD